MTAWTKFQGIWSMNFKVKGNRFILEVSPRFDMSDMDEPVDLERMNEHQLILCRGPAFEEKDDVFLGYYPDRLMAGNTGLQIFHYMNGRIIRPRPKPLTIVIAILLILIVLMSSPSIIEREELTNITSQQPVKELFKEPLKPSLPLKKPK